jgi:hypothetical protein
MGIFSRRSKPEPEQPQSSPPQPPPESQQPQSPPELKSDLSQPSFGPPSLNVPGLGTDGGGGLSIPSMSGSGGKLYDPYEGEQFEDVLRKEDCGAFVQNPTLHARL